MGSSKKVIKRGALLVFEGCDRIGKSTQSKLLMENLKSRGIPVKHMVFPARDSNIGREINAYLTNTKDLSDHVIHLLFSANRWEFQNDIYNCLKDGTTLIVDRYSYSGVAYSTAKGLDYDWCFAPEKGLIQPDAVFYLNTNIEKILERGSFGEERYEKKELQRKVAEVFNQIYAQEQHYWHSFDASLPVDVLAKQVSEKAAKIVDEVDDKSLLLLN